MKPILLRLMILCLLVAGPAAQALAQAAPTFAAARDTYAQARDGKADLDRAREVLEAFLQAHPGHPVVTAYLGSVRAMIGRDAFFPFTKLANVNEGLELLDKAVEHLDQAEAEAGYDGRLDVLMVSGLTNAGVPGSFGRRAMAERDLKAARALPSFASLSAQDKATVYGWLAVYASARNAAEAESLLALARAEDQAIADALWTEER